ncbi:glycosyltransferase [Pacificibacter sp. AS14]|uniref:glycosyltransferase n=1 Tax=Pacificibacter sp. AS14 TaxID=3135785 RepID=UPI0031797389
MTKASKIDAEQQLPELAGIPSSIIPHGHYLAAIEESLQGQDALASTDVPSSSQAGGYLFFGSITRYKNAHKLLQAFLQLPTGSAQLTIKGKMSASSPDNDLMNLLNTLPPERTSDVIFENRFLSEDELVDAIQRSDLVVFPYSDVLNSGAALFALSVGRPILASDTALFRELRSQVGEDWVRLIDGELDAAQLSVALDQARVQKTKGLAPDLSVFDWNRIAKQTVDFYQYVIDAQKGPKA